MKLDILAISAHPDDVEVSAGGTLLHHISLGKKVGLLDLTKAELSTRGDIRQREKEAAAAAGILGAAMRDQLGLSDGFFSVDQPTLLKVVSKIRTYQPEIILANSFEDRHPDHQRAASLIEQAVFLSNLIKVETHNESGDPQAPWRTKGVYHYVQDRTCQPDFVVDISAFIDKKFEAIRAYTSQFYQPDCSDPETPISCPSFFDALRGRNAMLGRQIGVEYAEAFTSARPVGIRDLFDLL